MLDPFTTRTGNDLVLLSLLILTMTFVMLRVGLSDPIGMAALLIQAGLLVRVNYVHRNSVRQVENKAGA